MSLVLAVVGCGGQSTQLDARRGSPAEQRRSGPAALDAGAVADAGPARSPETDSAPPPAFTDPGCPEVVEARTAATCDPFAEVTGCPAGSACYPFVSYPDGPCEVETYGTFCAPAGEGQQGDDCGASACASGHVCVSSGVGTRCVQLCSFETAITALCPPGLVCLPIDIEGFGGCL